MTIRDYVTKQNDMSINEWIDKLKKDGFAKHESVILSCADSLNKITFDYDSDNIQIDFIKTINIINK